MNFSQLLTEMYSFHIFDTVIIIIITITLVIIINVIIIITLVNIKIMTIVAMMIINCQQNPTMTKYMVEIWRQ